MLPGRGRGVPGWFFRRSPRKNQRERKSRKLYDLRKRESKRKMEQR
jgi:hypothetical protein